MSPEAPLWSSGFRPFYLLASVFAALSVFAWVLQYAGLVARWDVLRTTQLIALNAVLRAAGKADITVSP